MIYAANCVAALHDADAVRVAASYGGSTTHWAHFDKAALDAVREARKTVARCIGAEPEEIYFTHSASEANVWVIKGTAFAAAPNAFFVTTRMEHRSALNAYVTIRHRGFPVLYAPTDNQGRVKPDSLDALLTEGASLVSVTCADNVLGTLQRVQEIAAIAHAHGALFHTDASTICGRLPFDAHECCADFVSFSGRKLGAPLDVGCLYIRKGAPLLPYACNGKPDLGLVAGMENPAAIAAFAAVMEKRCAAPSVKSLTAVETAAKEALEGLPCRILNAPDHVPGLLTLCFEGEDGEELVNAMARRKVRLADCFFRDKGERYLTHELRTIGLTESQAAGTVRICFGFDATIEDARKVAAALRRLLSRTPEEAERSRSKLAQARRKSPSLVPTTNASASDVVTDESNAPFVSRDISAILDRLLTERMWLNVPDEAAEQQGLQWEIFSDEENE